MAKTEAAIRGLTPPPGRGKTQYRTGWGLKPANQLKKGDTVFDAQGNPHPVTILETLPIEEGQRVINVDLAVASSDANERLIVSEGIITGDIVLQGLLKERK